MSNSLLIAGTLVANRFEIQQASGAGGMGTVFRAYDRFCGKCVALKLMHSTRASVSETERFTREAQVLATLHHPNIVSYVAHGHTSEGQQYLALEWLDGEDLARRLTRGPLSFSDTLKFLRRIASALAVAHRKGIVHRDIKPSNLFLRNDDIDRVTLIDFGIARRELPERPITKTGFSIGTPAYMAPEQSRGEREITAAADVFSLGCVVYECLTGEPLYVGEYSVLKSGGFSYEEGTPIQTLLPWIPDQFRVLLERMCNKVPTERMPNSGALLQELEALGDELGPASSPVMPESRTAKPDPYATEERTLATLMLAVSRLDDMLDEASTVELSRAMHLEEMTSGATKPTLQRAARRFGTQARWLSDGSLVAGINQTANIADPVRRVAQCALTLRTLWPGAQIVVATGFVEGPLLDTSSELWGRLQQMAHERQGREFPDHRLTGEIVVDELSASLLAVNYLIERKDNLLLLGAKHIDANQVRSLRSVATSCVGRDRELGELDAALAESIEDSVAQALLVVGPDGIGKSRLRHEFLKQLSTSMTDVLLLTALGEDLGMAPYRYVGQMLERLVVADLHQPSHDAEARQQCLHDRLARNLPPDEVPQVLEFLLAICTFWESGESTLLKSSDHEANSVFRASITRAFVRFLAAECRQKPVVLVLDDLQWADTASLQLMDAVLRELKNQPMLLLAFGTRELLQQTAALWAGRKMQTLELSPLSKRSCESLVRQVLGKHISGTLLSRIVTLSIGNPQLLEELILHSTDASVSKPSETLLTLGYARLMRLEPGARRLLRVASVFGPTFWAQGIISVLGVKERPEEVTVWLKSLTDAELIERLEHSTIPGEEEYAWRHELLRDAAEHTLLRPDYTLVGQAAARWLAQVGAIERANLVKAGTEKAASTIVPEAALPSSTELAG